MSVVSVLVSVMMPLSLKHELIYMLLVINIFAKTESTKCSTYRNSKHDWCIYAALPPSSGPDSANEKCIILVQIQKVLLRVSD